MSEPAEGTEPPSVLQPQNLNKISILDGIWSFFRICRRISHFQGRGNDHQLLFVIGRGNTLEGLEPLQSVLAALSLVGGHATHLGVTTSKQSI